MATRKKTTRKSSTRRSAAKKSGTRKTARKTAARKTRSTKTTAQKKVRKVMKERKAGTLRSGRSGRKVKSRKQAIAIGLSEARKAGAKIPRKRKSA